LAVNNDLPYTLCWSKDREEYITVCNCCPPNIVRTMAQINNYSYSTSEKGIWCHLYAESELSTNLANGSPVALKQETNYPWDGDVQITLTETKSELYSLFMRIPQWADEAEIAINGKSSGVKANPGKYAEINRKWKKGDVVTLKMHMRTKIIESHPLVEETRNQVAAQCGPLVYCLESPDMPEGLRIFDLAIPSDIHFQTKETEIDGSKIASLEGDLLVVSQQNWGNNLYREAFLTPEKRIRVRLIPYYAWNNRGVSEMTVWIPVR
jgi:uncharacterized protein